MRIAALTILIITLAAAAFGAETMLDYFKGRLPATIPPAATDELWIMQGNGTAVRRIKPGGLGFVDNPRFSNLSGNAVRNTDPRLSDARNPLPHSQSAGTITGLASVATSGSYADLSNQPTIPSAATDISYTNPTYTTVAAALDQLLYVAPSITSHTNRISYGTSAPYNQTVSGTASTNTIEIGNTVSRVELFWALNKTVTTQSYDQGIGSIGAALRAYDHTGQSFTSSRTYTLTVGDGTSTDNSPATVVTLSPRRYWAPTTIPLASLTSANVIALAGSEFSSSHSKTGTTYDCTGGRYPTYAFVSSAGTLTATTVGGLLFTDYSYRTISVTNASGYTQNYYVYQFNSIQSGSNIIVNWD